jgi:hypothetical protein
MIMNRPAPSRYILLAAVSALTGALAGFIGYLIGQYFYVLFLYPFILLAIGAILYFPSLRFFGTSNSLFNGFCGLLLGLMIFFVFHFIEYSLFRTKNISLFMLQGMNQSAASQAVNAFLQKVTGLGGFAGFVKYQNSLWNPYVYYVLQSSRVAHTLKIYLHGKTGWLYLVGEVFVLLGGSALIGFFSRKFFPVGARV